MNMNAPSSANGICMSSSEKTFFGKVVISVKGASPSVRFISTKRRTAASCSRALNLWVRVPPSVRRIYRPHRYRPHRPQTTDHTERTELVGEGAAISEADLQTTPLQTTQTTNQTTQREHRPHSSQKTIMYRMWKISNKNTNLTSEIAISCEQCCRIINL